VPKPAGKLAVFLFTILLMAAGGLALAKVKDGFERWLPRDEGAKHFQARLSSRSAWSRPTAEQLVRYGEAVGLLEGSEAIEKAFVTDVRWQYVGYGPDPPDWFFAGLLVVWLQDTPGIDAVRLRMLDAAGEELAVVVEPVDYHAPPEREGSASWHVQRLVIALSAPGEKPWERETSGGSQVKDIVLSAPLSREAQRLAIALVSTDHGASNEVEVDVGWLNLAYEAKQGSKEALAVLDTHVSRAATSSQDNLYYLQLRLTDDLRLAEGFPGKGRRLVRPADILLWLESNEGNVFWDAGKRMWRLKDAQDAESAETQSSEAEERMKRRRDAQDAEAQSSAIEK